MTQQQRKKIINKLYEASQELALEAFMSITQSEASKLYDASHLIDKAILMLKD